ncbi:hypothetical protein CROQUDRAFT_694272 [Cronartium quercuum f. sp. fusiforme G11]|uniref:Uncharacterized protein n=1 Tax=Cronartium quercuum f. sp. fusiforme G11 TaxID=708437 RepID=A0A9P6NQH5_9BASI|nr:hypothetical protein CROQUDRAFT_694272 [Cronartium quercuum f. sp. fusiforme G11]
MNRMPWDLLADRTDIYEFCCWKGRQHGTAEAQDIISRTLKQYLYGLKAWHRYQKSRLIIIGIKERGLSTASNTKADGSRIETHDSTSNRTCKKDRFRNGNFRYSMCGLLGDGPIVRVDVRIEDRVLDYRNSVLAKEVQFDAKKQTAPIVLRGTKTCQPGEYQLLHVGQQRHLLCPVKALKRRLAGVKSLTLPQRS